MQVDAAGICPSCRIGRKNWVRPLNNLPIFDRCKVVPVLNYSSSKPPRRRGGVDLYVNPHFFNLRISWRWVVSFTPLSLYPREKAPGIHSIGEWVGPRAGLDHAKKRKCLPLPGLELQPLRPPARSQSLYRLCYPGSSIFDRYESKLNVSSSISCNTKFNVNLLSSFKMWKIWTDPRHFHYMRLLSSLSPQST
jgi:hypothetical protein